MAAKVQQPTSKRRNSVAEGDVLKGQECGVSWGAGILATPLQSDWQGEAAPRLSEHGG